MNPYLRELHKKNNLQLEMIIPDVLPVGNMMQRPQFKLTSKCQECGEPINRIIFAADWYAWFDGEYMQDVWSDLSPEEREEICLCIHVGCSDKFYGVGEE